MSKPKDGLPGLAGETLEAFQALADAAAAELNEAGRPSDGSALASANTMTDLRPQQALQAIDEERRRDLAKIAAEPTIARVEIIDEDGKARLLYISRVTPPRGVPKGAMVASYRSPLGRLAVVGVGEEVTVRAPGGDKVYEIRARADLKPFNAEAGWDSRDTVVYGYADAPQTITSLREFLAGSAAGGADLLDQLLEQDSAARHVSAGIRRAVIEKMGLRDRPLLDRYQDDIFRLPVSAKIAVLGPPGSGKTTTLIKRLGLKLDYQHLPDEDRELIGRSSAGQSGHARSWIMFTPSQLLKQYVKEAFARERVPAPDDNIRTWDDFRRDVARNTLGILRTATTAGAVLKADLQSLRPAAIEDQSSWYEAFRTAQDERFWSELARSAAILSDSADGRVARLGAQLISMLARERVRGAGGVAALDAIAPEIAGVADELRGALDQKLRGLLSAELRKDPKMLDALLELVTGLDDDDAESEDEEDDDEEGPPATVKDRQFAFAAYVRAVTALARSRTRGRRLGAATRNGRIIAWLAERAPADNELTEIGATAVEVSALRRFANPVRQYLRRLPARYRWHRRQAQAEAHWYAEKGFNADELAPLEVDAIMLAVLSAGDIMLRDARLRQRLEAPALLPLRAIHDLRRSQIVVDEATDFGPLQLAAMAKLADPAIGAFVACGDFNQRITSWGARSYQDLLWAEPGLDIREIRITYRHTRQLNEFAQALASAGGTGSTPALLPEHVDSEGVSPLLATGFKDQNAVVSWLAARLREIEARHPLPSVAVLVNSEEEVMPLAAALNAVLEGLNVQCVGCPNGQAVGQDNDVRVFDVRHIKGLEFEAVFFIGVDELAEQKPDLFEKFLYVGATRAATYLGLVSRNAEPPQPLKRLEGMFAREWS